jgi:hypothetical protein
MQFFAVVFLALFIRALHRGRARDIVGSSIALVAMYFSHEESFVLLPALPLMALFARQVVWSRRRTFTVAFLPAGILIGLQYVVSHIHPPDFGDDLSNRPYVGWDTNQADFYYQRIFFGPLHHTGSLAILSLLAVIAVVTALRGHDLATKLAAVALCTSVAAVTLIFTAKVDRYSFVMLPLLVAMATIGAAQVMTAVGRGITHADRVVGSLRSAGFRLIAVTAAAVMACAVLATLVISPRNFGLWAADATGSPNPLTHPDYRRTVDYLSSHVKSGDQVITLSPPVMTALYLGRSPDQIIQTGTNKLLYLVLRDGRAVDTVLGRPVLVTGKQIRTFLELHSRVWLVSDTGSFAQGVPPDVRAEIIADFHIVNQDAGTTISLWDTT